ncbi:unnamed protein product [Effrenium voratum]|nr:unnamed protein product [Effrenium voratum]
MRQESRKMWITESIAFRSKLKKARRLRVREVQANNTQIHSAVEGCVCSESWSVYIWKKLRPRHLTFRGCVEDRDKLGEELRVNTSSLQGLCEVKQETSTALRLAI